MFRNLWTWILTTIFRVKTQTGSTEIETNERFLLDYRKIDDINFNAIFSKKLANFTINDSSINVEGKK